MVALVQAVRKTVLVMFLLILFIAFSTLCGIVFLATFQWFMHTEFYLGVVGSVDFLILMLGFTFIIIFFFFCTDVDYENLLNKDVLLKHFSYYCLNGLMCLNHILIFLYRAVLLNNREWT